MKKFMMSGVGLISLANISAAVVLDHFDRDTYNSLPSVAIASRNLERNGNLEKVLEEGKKTVSDYDSVDFMGVRLLHRHNLLDLGEVMIEEFQTYEEAPALVTRNSSVDVSFEGKPASWMGKFGGTFVFEYSTDKNVKEGFRYLKEHPSLFLQIKGILQSYDLEDILAPAIVSRSVMPLFGDTDRLIEFGKRRKTERGTEYRSILQNIPLNKQGNSNIFMTNWGFVGKPKTVGCMWQYNICEEDICDLIHIWTLPLG